MAARPLEVLAAPAVVCRLYVTGGRGLLSSNSAAPRLLGNSGSRWPCADSWTALSVRRRLIAEVATVADCDWVAEAPRVLFLCVSGSEVGRFELTATSSPDVVSVRED